LGGGPPRFPQDFSCPTVLRCSPHGAASFSGTGLSPPPVVLPSDVPLNSRFLTPRPVLYPAQTSPPTPTAQRYRPLTYGEFGLFPVRSPLLRESLARFLLLQVLRWFSSLGLASADYVFPRGCVGRPHTGYPIRPPPALRMFAPPRGFSQLTTAFLASQLLGIHHGPFLA
jgi:hypothetical protein